MILICSLAVVSIIFKQSTEYQIQQHLTVAQQVFLQLLDVQAQRLSDNSYLLSSDFSFKRVIATQDKATITSALDNLLLRIGADTAMLVSLQHQILADTRQANNNHSFFAPELIQSAQQHGTANAIIMLDGIPQQMVVTPIMAPDLKAWLCVSFKMHKIQLHKLSALTQAHISLLLVKNNHPPVLISSSLPDTPKNALQQSLEHFNWKSQESITITLKGNQYLTSQLNLSISDDFTIIALIQKSLDKELLPFYRLQWLLLIIALISLSLAFIGSVVVARSVSRPVKALVKGVREVGQGNYEYRINIDRNDEIGELGLAFNEMAKSQKRQVALKLAKENAENASQAKTEFLANMSHELRSPLNSILGYAQLLQQQNQEPLSIQQQKALLTIEQSGKHLLALINEILDLSKIEAGQLELQNKGFDLTELLQQLVEMMQTRAENKGLKLTVEFKLQSTNWIHSDQQRLRQVLMNLLDNAIKYTLFGQIHFKVSNEGNRYYTFSITDTGIGIAPEHLPDIFTSFHQLHQTRGYVEGTGLGLAISDRLVQLLGGELNVNSELEKGSCFWFELKLNQALQATAYLPSKLSSSFNYTIGKQRKIIIADSKVENRDLLSDLLSPLEFHTTPVNNGLDCIQLAQSIAPDIILLNSNLPKINGLEVCRQIRANITSPSIVLIVISANVFSDHRQACLDAGADDFLPKPFQIDTLFQLLEQHTDFSTNTNIETADTKATLLEIQSPDVGDLQRLQGFAEQGDIQSIRLLISEMNQLNPQCTQFFQQLTTWVNDFKINRIRQALEHALEKTQKNHDNKQS